MNATPDRLTSGARADDGLPSREDAVTQVLDAILDRRGMATLTTAGDGAAVLHALGSRLPSTYRWCVAEAPTTPIAVWNALFEGALPDGQEPGPQLREMLWRRSCAGVGTVLGVTDTPAVPDEVLSVLEELAGMEPMLQVVLAADRAAPTRNTEAAARLAMRVRTHVEVGAGPPGRPVESAAPQVELAREARREPVSVATETPRESPGYREQSSDRHAGLRTAPVVAGRGFAGAPRLEAASQRAFDPFRGRFTEQSIDSPQLLPVLSDPHGLHAEWFRVLRLRLEDWARTRGGSQAIAISGPEAGVGKTFVAANLALLWANCTFERVLLVDGDLRRPQFHALFEIPQRPGLADVLARRCNPEDAVSFVDEVGLHVMPAGRAGNPRQLVNPDRVARVMEALKSSFDVVILDGPPLVGLVDGRSFAGACDGTLMVVRAGATRMRALQKATEELPEGSLIGAVVNGVDLGTKNAYTQYRRAVGR